jgi:hypothetical protein
MNPRLSLALKIVAVCASAALLTGYAAVFASTKAASATPDKPSTRIVIDGVMFDVERYPIAVAGGAGNVISYWWTTTLDGKEIRFNAPWYTMPRE